MTGLKTGAMAWLGGCGVIAAWQALVQVYGEFLGLSGSAAVLAAIATILTSLPIIAGRLRRGWRWGRKAGRAINAVLGVDVKLDRHIEDSQEHWREVRRQLDAGEMRFERMEARLDAYAQSERAAVRGALEATQRPRSARSTDPGERDGWRE